MNNNLDENNSEQSHIEMDLREILSIVWKSKVLLVGITFAFSLFALIYSLYLPNVYKSKALLSPVGEQNNMSSSMRGVGGIASLAGINLGSESNSNNSVKALDKLNSLSFFSDNILPNIFLPDLMAIKSWDSANNKIIYDERIYDETNQTWVRDFKYPQTQIPSAQESYEIFIDNHFSMSQDQETFFVTIAVKHQSPYIAHQWTELIVKELNKFFRIKDKAEAQAAIDYLNGQIALTSFTEIKVAIAELFQKKTQQLALIEVSDFYVYDYIDPPAVMEKKSEPKRLIILVIGGFVGIIVAMFAILLRHKFINNNH